MTAIEDAIERIQARIRHNAGCQECDDFRALITQYEHLTERLAAHQKLGLAAIFLADTFDEGADPDSELSKMRDEWLESKITERLSAPPTDDERECLDCGRTDGGCDRVQEIAVTLRPTPSDRDGTARARAILDDEREALAAEWLATYHGSIDATALTLAFKAGFAAGFRRQRPTPDARPGTRGNCAVCGDPIARIIHTGNVPGPWRHANAQYLAYQHVAVEATERAR